MVTPEFTHDAPGTSPSAWKGCHEPLDLSRFDRVVVVAAHPDDETLGAGGLVATATSRKVEVAILVATAGEASHPGSSSVTARELAMVRSHELVSAVIELGLDPGCLLELGLPDGRLAGACTSLTAAIVSLVGDGRTTLLVAPWRGDGHPDHEAAGASAATAARRTGAALAEYPVWFWHWGDPQDPRARRMVGLELTVPAYAAKQRAISRHRSQVEPLSNDPGDAPILGPHFLTHFQTGVERFWLAESAACPDDSLDRLHRTRPDPWGVDARWFEQRKRDLILAALPRLTFHSVLDLGCSTGALTAALAGRLQPEQGHLTAVDSSATAVAKARERLHALPNVNVQHLAFPHAWPDGVFDLVVISEVGYFLAPVDVELLAQRVAASLRPGGVVVLCHWRHTIDGWVLDAAGVDRHFVAPTLPPLQATYDDSDVSMRVLCSDWPAPDR